MAFYMTNPTVTLGATDLTGYVTSISLARSFSELDVTAMGDAGRTVVAGLEESSVTLDILNDSLVIDTLNGFAGTTQTLVVVEQVNTYTMTVLVSQLQPVNGARTDMSAQSVTWPVSGAVTVS